MSTRSLRNRLADTTNIWPGFVDVLATLLIVIIFVLMVFTVSQIYLSDAISGRDKALQDLRSQINELSKIFSLMGIETHDVLEAAGTKWNFLHFKPGLVGGHCIGVDPYYLCLLYTSPSPRDISGSRMPSSA